VRGEAFVKGPALQGGVEWVIDAHGCDAARLRSSQPLRALFARAIEELGLKPVAAPVWHEFGGEGGVSGLVLLAESHLSCHSFPESRYLALNLYCCRPRPAWDWAAQLREAVGAERVDVRALERPR
jgi:S-adenosylmethionine decarboxylase